MDRSIRIWQKSPKERAVFKLAATLESHAGTVNCLAVSKSSDLIASGSSDATVKIWRLTLTENNLVTEIVQTIQVKPRFFPLSLSLHDLASSQGILLAVGGTNCLVQVYVGSQYGALILQATLTGHEGWVRSVAIAREAQVINGDLMLASASQDKYIRLWRIKEVSLDPETDSDNLVVSSGQSLTNRIHRLTFTHISYDISFESLLLGHEDWIYTIQWRLDADRLQLLSASADNSLAIWELEEKSGIWVCTTRLGEISAQKGSTTATGSTGGFWIGLWSQSGEHLVSLGKTGGWRLWDYDRSHSRWIQGMGISGHTKAVTDLAWSKDGNYLLSTSSDQTTRLHAARGDLDQQTWHEMARPQIHGYDLNCIDSINPTSFISGADEKLLRVFDEPRSTADLLYHLCGIKNYSEQNLPDAADIPVLGLSNKAIEHAEGDENGHDACDNIELSGMENLEAYIPASSVDHPPSEDQLARHTLWPEKEKLYGHGFEISAVAASNDGELVATACKASSLEHSVIRLYTTKDWREVKPSLTAHLLTVTAMKFAGDDQYLLSAGRDRQWALFRRDEHNSDRYLLKHSNPKGHSRMIFNVSWAPLDAGRIFATAGRDKTIKIWNFDDYAFECTASIAFRCPVTAIDFYPYVFQDTVAIVSGSEVGDVAIHVIQRSNWFVRKAIELENS